MVYLAMPIHQKVMNLSAWSKHFSSSKVKCILSNQINSEITKTVKSEHENEVNRSQRMEIPIRFVHYHLQADSYKVKQSHIYKHDIIFIRRGYSLHSRAYLTDKTSNVNILNCYNKFPLSNFRYPPSTFSQYLYINIYHYNKLAQNI